MKTTMTRQKKLQEEITLYTVTVQDVVVTNGSSPAPVPAFCSMLLLFGQNKEHSVVIILNIPRLMEFQT